MEGGGRITWGTLAPRVIASQATNMVSPNTTGISSPSPLLSR